MNIMRFSHLSLFIKKHANKQYAEALLQNILNNHPKFNSQLPFYTYPNDHIHICPDQYEYDDQAIKVFQKFSRVV